MNTQPWTMPEDENAPVTVGEARQLLAAWVAVEIGGVVPAAIGDRIYDCAPDFVRLAVEQADRADAAERELAAEKERAAHSIPMRDILAARDVFDIGTPEYEAIDDLIAGKWSIGE